LRDAIIVTILGTPEAGRLLSAGSSRPIRELAK
jgi:hypothetical protein